MKILFINQPPPNNDYAQSQLYYGFKKLGHQVFCYPKNHTFHFETLQNCDIECKNGPCSISNKTGCFHPSHLTLKEEFTSQYIGDFIPDVTITNNGYGMEMLYRTPIIAKSKIVALDLGDSTYDSYNEWTQCIGRKPDLFLRREHLQNQNGLIFDYAFYDEKFIKRPTNQLIYSVAYMHRPTNAERAMYGEIIKTIPNSIVGEFKYQEYLEILSYSKFAVAMPGAGQITVRHAEIPARGAVLCKKILPQQYSHRPYQPSIEFSTPEQLVSAIKENTDISKYNFLREASWTNALKYGTATSRIKHILENICS